MGDLQYLKLDVVRVKRFERKRIRSLELNLLSHCITRARSPFPKKFGSVGRCYEGSTGHTVNIHSYLAA